MSAALLPVPSLLLLFLSPLLLLFLLFLPLLFLLKLYKQRMREELAPAPRALSLLPSLSGFPSNKAEAALTAHSRPVNSALLFYLHMC